MSYCWSNLTGGLVYDGEPVVTAVIRGLFGPMRLSGENEELTEIKRITDDVCPSWEEVAESLMEELGIDKSDVGADEDQIRLVATVRERFGEEAATKLDELVTLGLGGLDPDVQDLLSLALLMRDGHNLKSVWEQGAWGGDRVTAGSFGGWAQFQSAHVSLALNTQRLCDIGRAVELACADGAGEESTVQAAEALSLLCGGCIQDAGARSRFQRGLAEWLLKQSEQAAVNEAREA